MTASGSNRRGLLDDGADLFRWICTKNPFYAVSAVLVLWGLWASFGMQTEETDVWLLMGGLAGYTLLLAATALVLVRFLKVWDDARTVLLLVVLMFLATSVTFDHLLMNLPVLGMTCCLLGLGLSIAISEGLLRKLGLPLPPLYRTPYYVLLGLFFLYPIFVGLLYEPGFPEAEPLQWGLFGFATVAGLAFLTLLPALRRGAAYVGPNPSPWPWPLYPWSVFVFFAVAVAGRAVLLCWSMQPLDMRKFDRLIFGPFFLVPFGFALAVLILEMGVLSKRRGVLRVAMLLPLILLGMAAVGYLPTDPIYRTLRVLTVSIGSYRAFDAVRMQPDEVYARFLNVFSQRLGADPLFCTLVLAIVYYAYAAWRRVPLATAGLTATFAALSVIATNSVKEGLLSPPEPGPLLAPAALQFFLALQRRNAWNYLLGSTFLAGAVALAVPLDALIAQAVFVHVVVLAMLVLGEAFAGAAGMAMRRMGAGIVLVLALTVMNQWLDVPEEFLPATPVIYPLAAGILLAGYGHFLRHSMSMAVAAAILGWWVFKFGWMLYRDIRGLLPGFDYIVSGCAFFVVALLVSVGKSGLLRRWIESRWKLPGWLRLTNGAQPPAAETPQG